MTPQHPSIWCAIPVYNNAGTILDIARECRSLVDHVIVIDDGSADADLRELLKLLDVTVIRHPTNRGKGKAILTAFAHAQASGADYLITIDGDGQHFPADLPRFFPHLSPDTILIGSRDEITGHMPGSSKFGREFSDFWIRLEAGGNARDTQSGFRAYPLAAVMQLQMRSHFYNFEMEIVTRALWAGMRAGGVPIRVWYPPANERVSSFDPFWDNLRISILHARLVLRQLLPIPHRPIDLSHPEPENTNSRRRLSLETADPTTLAVSAALSILMGIVLWPWGFLATAYVIVRLHLSKMIALLFTLACLPPIVMRVCRDVGRTLISDAHPHLQWIAGSHAVAIPSALCAGCVIYKLQSRSLAARYGRMALGTTV